MKIIYALTFGIIATLGLSAGMISGYIQRVRTPPVVIAKPTPAPVYDDCDNDVILGTHTAYSTGSDISYESTARAISSTLSQHPEVKNVSRFKLIGMQATVARYSHDSYMTAQEYLIYAVCKGDK